MKVLFAVNNDNISNAIVKKYQQEYKEIISYKNVYYFNAILKELQNNRTYDRIVISEDLEPFANNNYDTIDKFLFEKLDRISDEATKANGEDIDIILICADRRGRSDEMLTRIFGIGIYNALIGDERSIDNLCKLMNQPRNKKEAKLAYKIEGNSVGYQAEDENNVSEAEVQNILAHYKRLGKDEDRYVDSFNNIVSQYTDAQLKIIIRYLPMNVKAVLEERSQKYQELSTFAKPTIGSKDQKYMPKTAKSLKNEEKIKVKMLKDEKDRINKPIVIPSALKNKKSTKIEEEKPKVEIPKVEPQYIEPQTIEPEHNNENDLLEQLDSEIQEMTKRGRGRPRKKPVEEVDENKPKRGRGRPRKTIETDENLEIEEVKTNNELESREDIEEDEFDLFSMDSENDNNEDNKIEKVEEDNEIDLFSLEDEKQEDDNDLDLFSLEQEDTLPVAQETEESDDNFNLLEPIEEPTIYESSNMDADEEDTTSIEPTYKPQMNLNTVLTSKKKLVTFVGTTKNGTSFVVNNLALMLSSMNISTAILDMTKSKNSYYIYTNDDNKLREVAEQCIFNLEKGVAQGIDVNKNLTVYTEVPGEGQEHKNIETILATLMEQHDVVLIDADFNTEQKYFENTQELYLVQSMDVLTIQPLTAFMRNLKSKGILRQEKLKIVINKWQKVGGLSEKVLIGGMSSYNDPAMSFMTELFDKENIQYCKIPFEIQNNVKYLESLVNCQMSLRGYTKQLMESLNVLASMVYPLYNQSGYSPLNGNKKSRMQFSEATRNTLNRMKNNY